MGLACGRAQTLSQARGPCATPHLTAHLVEAHHGDAVDAGLLAESNVQTGVCRVGLQGGSGEWDGQVPMHRRGRPGLECEARASTRHERARLVACCS